MSIWDDFYRLDSLDLAFTNNSSAEKATIFGNGKNQISISIKVKIVDKYNNPLAIPADELVKCVHLVNYRNGNRLDWKGNAKDSKPWGYTDVVNDYNNGFSYDRVFSDPYIGSQIGEQEVTFYLYATDQSSDGIDIAAGINVPGVGDFNTSANGTSTKNGPEGKTGSPFIVPRKKHIEAKLKINYGDKRNIEIDKGALVHNNNFNWEISKTPLPPDPEIATFIEEKSNGEVWTCSVEFKPKLLEIGVFKEWSISYDALKNKHVNGGFWNVVDGITAGYWAIPNEKILDTLPDNPWFPEQPDSAYPCAVFHKANWGHSKDEAHINFWHPGDDKFLVDGHLFIYEDGTIDLFKLKVKTSGQHEKTEVPTIQLYKFLIRRSNTKNILFWQGRAHLATIRVIDRFGNSGEIKITFNDEDNFDVPGIV